MYDYPFDDVCRTMARASIVATVDSFPNRLAHAVGVKNHILLASGSHKLAWQGYPGINVVMGEYDEKNERATWDLDSVITAISALEA